MRLASFVILLPLVLGPTTQAAQDRWARADSVLRRLPPSAFPQVPRLIRQALERRGCTIPQVALLGVPDSARTNVVAGSFTRRSRREWAVLCSVDRISRILVFVRGRVDSILELAPAADRQYLQLDSNNAVGYTRALARARPAHIRRHARAFDSPLPSPIDHDGIEDAFVEKASQIWYWHRGQWLILMGMD